MARSINVGFFFALVVGVALAGAQVVFAASEHIWIWRVATFASLALAALLGGLGLWRWFTEDRPENLDFNYTLNDAATYYLPYLRDEDLSASKYLQGLFGLCLDIRQKARLGHLAVWGRKNCDVWHTNIPLSPIPAEFWERGEIDAVQFLKRGVHSKGQTGCDMLGRPSEYSDLRFNRRQLMRVLGRRWPAVKLRMPLVIEKRR